MSRISSSATAIIPKYVPLKGDVLAKATAALNPGEQQELKRLLDGPERKLASMEFGKKTHVVLSKSEPNGNELLRRLFLAVSKDGTAYEAGGIGSTIADALKNLCQKAKGSNVVN